LDLFPPSTPSLPADYYRHHAARVRELAVEATTPEIREQFHDIARQYDGLAEMAEEAARTRTGSA
jgi:hypothetical protein